MQQAYAQANDIVTAATEQAQEILDNATNDANDIRIGAMQYTDDIMSNVENIIGHTLDSYTTKYDGLVNSLRECYDIVKTNRAELEVPDKSDRGMEAEFGSDSMDE
jgi:cell division septum initiation protein DivIVA